MLSFNDILPLLNGDVHSFEDIFAIILNASPSHIFPNPTTIDAYLTILCTSGSLTLIINDQEYDLHIGESIAMPPTTKLSHINRFNEDCRCFITLSRADYFITNAGALTKDLLISFRENPITCYDQTELDIIKDSHLLCAKIIDSKKSNRGALTSILRGFFACFNARTLNRDVFIKQRILDAINLYAYPDISIEFISNHLSMSTSQLSKYIKENFGTSFKQLANDAIVRKATQRLSATSSTISSICYELGFEEPSNFSRFFKTHLGLSPSEYRRAIKKGR
ncbi:MAG: helix-turn-helix domain-containing protein [Bacteroidales bacterium]|nr:helix-turn-helix domain-containing protein [Bacteroidales bacterium]